MENARLIHKQCICEVAIQNIDPRAFVKHVLHNKNIQCERTAVPRGCSVNNMSNIEKFSETKSIDY